MTFKEAVEQSLVEFNALLKQDLDNKKFTDTSKAKNSLRVETGRSYGIDYFQFIDEGSKKWSNPDNYKALGFILEESGWASRREINPYAAAYAIANKGSQVAQGSRAGLEVDNKIKWLEKRLNELLSQAAESYAIKELNKAHAKITRRI